MGCLTASAIVAIGVGAIIGVAWRDRWREPNPLTPVSAQLGQAAFTAEVTRYSSRAMVPEGQPADEATQPYGVGWSRWTHRFEIRADECVALVVAAGQGYAAPRFAGLFTADFGAEPVFDARVAQQATQQYGTDPRWLYSTSTEGVATSVTWCAHQAKSVEARVMFRTLDGFSPPRRADATARWQLLRAPWASFGGPAALHGSSMQTPALLALAAEFDDPLGAAQRQPPTGMSETPPSRDILVAVAALLPVNASTAGELYALAARDSGIAVNPRLPGTLTTEERAIVTASYSGAAMGRALPAEHDPIVDLGRNDFYRVILVVDSSQLPSSCATFTFARGQGLFAPRISRYVRATRQRTPLTAVRDNVATDRVCPTEGVFSYIVDDTDQQTYRVSQWTTEPAPVVRAGRGRAR